MKKIWIVVTVESGITTDLNIFTSYDEAESYKLKEEERTNLEDDSISIFEKQVSGLK